jgi:hypothetical protein
MQSRILTSVGGLFLASASSGDFRVESVNSNVQAGLDYRLNGAWAGAADLTQVFTGKDADIPMSINPISTTGSPSFHSTTQQFLWFVHGR